MKLFLKSCLLLLGCVAFSVLSCEDVDLKGEEAGEVQGFWELNQTTGSNTFLLISSVEVVFYYYDEIENCITVEAYNVVRIDEGGFYILTQEGLEENKVLAVSRNGDRIHVRDINDTQSNLDKYFLSTVDINTLAPVCVDSTNVFGEWELIVENQSPVYLSIAEDSIKVIDLNPEQQCYYISRLEVFAIEGNVFTISDNDPFSNTGTQEVTLIRTQKGLEVRRLESGTPVIEIFSESSTDFSSLQPFCELEPVENFEGQWQFNAGVAGDAEFYLIIDPTSFSFHYLIGDPINDPDNVCFEVERFEIVEFSEGTVTLRATIEPFSEIKFLIEFRGEEGLLYLDDTLDILSFFPTTIDVNYINKLCDIIPVN